MIDAGNKPQRVGRIVRHAIVRVRVAAAEEVCVHGGDTASGARAAAWIAAGLPLVVRRQDDTPRDALALGLCLPLAEGKRRIALTVPLASIAGIAPPPALEDVAASAPAAWRIAIVALARRAAHAGIAFRVFGSLAWQHLTNLPYVDAGSDIDVAWKPRTPLELAAGIALLVHWERESGLRADGEIVFGAGEAVAWREWSLPVRSRVLVKCLDGVSMRTRQALLATIAKGASGKPRGLAGHPAGDLS